jgi:hypothetical protein
MQFVGDAVMAVFGAPVPSDDHADRAVVAAASMHALQNEINTRWEIEGLPAFGLGIGLSTGESRRPSWVPKNDSSTRSWATPSTSPSDSNSSPRPARP